MTTDNSTQTKLTTVQKREAISLFKSGVETYTQISENIGVPYKLVNAFMTKWKYKHGILKKRSTRSDKKPKYVKPIVKKIKIEESSYEYIPNIVLEELKFLRDFYRTTIDSVQAVILQKEMHSQRNGTH